MTSKRLQQNSVCIVHMTESTLNYFGGFFLSLCLKYGFNFGNEWFWNSRISIFYWGSFQNAHIWTRLGTRTKKRRNMQNTNLKKQKKILLWGKILCVSFSTIRFDSIKLRKSRGFRVFEARFHIKKNQIFCQGGPPPGLSRVNLVALLF